MAYEGYDYSGIEAQLKQRAQLKGVQYDPSDLEGIQRNASYTGQGTQAIAPEQGLANAFGNYDQRATNTPGGGAAPVQYATPTQAWNNQPATAQANPQMSQLYSLLMQRAQQGPVTASDPRVRAQVDPAVAQLTREKRSYLGDVAEKAGPLANIQSESRLASERAGQQSARLEGDTIARLDEQRSQEIQQTLSLYGSLMSADQQMALQRELAYLQDKRAAAGQDVQRQSLSLNNDQFLRDLALREYGLNNSIDLNWAQLGG